MPTAVSLFTGCGGSDIGLNRAGFDILMANDRLRYARDTYMANLPETDYVLDDIRNVKQFPTADLLVGCYPCQGYSQGGVRDVGRSINYLFREFDRALKKIRPKAFIVENVSGLRRKNNRSLFEEQIGLFQQSGYKVDWRMLCAADYGVAQDRQRVFIVGIRNDLRVTYQWPEATHGMGRPSDFVSIRQALDGLPIWPVGEFNEEPFHWYYLSRNRRRDWHETSKTIVSRDRHMPLHPISPPLIRLDTDHFVFSSDDPARRFSYREAARLQGLGDLSWPENRGIHSRYKVVGNAVPPPLFEAVAGALPVRLWN